MADLRSGDWRTTLDDVTSVDHLITDPPYSPRTHRGHDGAAGAGRRDTYSRKPLEYDSIDEADVNDFVRFWHPRVSGWICVLTDHMLAPAWSRGLEAAGRYVFSPLACVDPGSRVRIVGDGPAQWSVWLVVARPRTRDAARWGALPGAYVRRSQRERSPITGGKPRWLMDAIVGDYSRPGDLICDPYAGSGTTLLSATALGRRAVGAELDPATYELARERLAQLVLPGQYKTGVALRELS